MLCLFIFDIEDLKMLVTMLKVLSGLNTLKFFFLQLYELRGYDYIQIPDEEGGILKYRIPFLDKEPLSGSMDLQIYYPIIEHDTLFYTFFVLDRDFNHSNTDTTDVIVLSGIDLDEI